MKYKILIAAFILFCSFTGPGDPPEVGISFKSYWAAKTAIAGYTKINARYEWVAGAFDSGLHVPQYNGVPTGRRSGVWNADGAIAADTANNRLYLYSGGAWNQVGTTYTSSNGITLTGSNFKLGGTLVDATTTVDINGNILQVVDVGNSRFLMNPGTTSLYSPSEQSFLDLDDNTAKLTGKDSLVLSQTSGNIRMRNLNYTLSTTGKKIMLRDTATGLVQNIDPSLLGGSTAISALTAATGTNSINNAGYNQTWEWNSIAGSTALIISSTSTSATGNAQSLFDVELSGVNSNSNQSTHAANIINSHTGTGAINIGLETQAKDAPGQNISITAAATGGASSTNIGIVSGASGGANNYAIIVPASEGSVGIGTSTPASILHTVGTVRHATLGTASGDTTANKPVGINSSGDIIPMTYWPGGGGGGSTLQQDTITLASFGGGARFQSDTAVFTDSTLYGAFYNDGSDTLIVTKIWAVMSGGTSDTLGVQLYYNDSLNVIGSAIATSTLPVNSTTVGNSTTTLTNQKIPPGNWVWCKSPTVIAGRKPYFLSVSMIGYKSRRL